MSTKSSIRYEHTDESGIGFHLYEEMFEEGNVYLELGALTSSLLAHHCPTAKNISAL